MALKRTKAKLRQPNQQEGTKNAKSPQFKHIEGRFKKILTSAIPTHTRRYGNSSHIVN